MTTTRANAIYTTDTADMIRNRIGEHVERIQERKEAAKGKLRRAFDFLFSCESYNPYNLPESMRSRLYL